MLGLMQRIRNADIWQNVAEEELLVDANVLVGGSDFFSKQKYSSLENVCELKKNGPYRCGNELVSLKIGNTIKHIWEIFHILSVE